MGILFLSLAILLWRDRHKILHMSRQHNCRDMCKILWRYDIKKLQYIKTTFSAHLSFGRAQSLEQSRKDTKISRDLSFPCQSIWRNDKASRQNSVKLPRSF